jgi:hypothetical protein
VTTRDVPKLNTVGVIACELAVPIHRVEHVLATRLHIRPAARAGTLRLYDSDAVAAIRREITEIDARRGCKEHRP